ISPWRGLAGQPEGRGECGELDGIRCTEVLVECGQAVLGTLLALHIQRGVVLAWHELRREGEICRCGERDLALRIDGDAAPVEDAEVARVHQRALKRGRRVAAFVAQPLK